MYSGGNNMEYNSGVLALVGKQMLLPAAALRLPSTKPLGQVPSAPA